MKVNQKVLNCKDVMTPRDIGEILGIGSTMVYKIFNTGELRSIRIGRKMLVPKQYLIEFLYPDATIED